ncbi:MAG: PQQ-dependent sugar dehydrogenase [Bacteroidota bacterium]
MKKITSLLIALVFTSITLHTSAQAPSIAIQPFAGGFSSPVDIQNCGDSRIFIVEQDGYIRIITDSGTVLPTPFLNIDNIVLSGGERGLLGLAFHPHYKENGYFYLYFNNNQGNLAISRFNVSAADSNVADAASQLNLITIPHPTNSNHNGGGIHFGPDGYLYFATGDGGGGGDQPNNAQNPAQRLGKILRVDVDNGTPYSIPLTNAYFNLPGYADEIWALGVRNPWRWSFDRLTGDLWIGDVGQGLWEEVDFVPPFTTGGHNFGWRCYEGNHAYNTVGCQAQANYDSAVYELSHSGGNQAIVGGYVYRGGKYGDMFGYYFFGDNNSDTIHALKRDPSGLIHHYAPITYNASLSAFGEDAEGNLYVANLNNGDVRKIVSTNCNPVAFVSDLDTVRVCADSVLLQSPFDASQIYSWATPSGNSGGNQVWVSQTGWVKLTVINFSACSNTDSAYYEILGTPAASNFTGLDSLYCSNGSVADTLIGTPLGGLFIGQGVNQDVFDPAVSGNGIWIINYVYTDSNNCNSTSSQIVTVETCSSIAQTVSSGLMILHVNTSSESIELGVKSAYSAPATYVLNDCTGRTVSTGKMKLTEGEQSIKLPVHAEDGIYFWTLYSNQDAVTFRFAVTH